jgi:GTP-binding protein LepA
MALGFGFRCGFLGMLHMEIVQERLEREYDLDLITTAPTVVYQIALTDGSVIEWTTRPRCRRSTRSTRSASRSSGPTSWCRRIPGCGDRPVRGEARGAGRHAVPRRPGAVEYELPLAEVVIDFFDRLKSCRRGFASFEYAFERTRAGRSLVDLMINGERVDALSSIVHRDQAQRRGRDLPNGCAT